MEAAMLGYWATSAGTVLQSFGIIWDAVDDLTGEEALGSLLTPEKLTFWDWSW